MRACRTPIDSVDSGFAVVRTHSSIPYYPLPLPQPAMLDCSLRATDAVMATKVCMLFPPFFISHVPKVIGKTPLLPHLYTIVGDKHNGNRVGCFSSRKGFHEEKGGEGRGGGREGRNEKQKKKHTI